MALPECEAIRRDVEESLGERDARYIRRCVQLLAAGGKEVGGWKALTVRATSSQAPSAMAITSAASGIATSATGSSLYRQALHVRRCLRAVPALVIFLGGPQHGVGHLNRR